MAKGLSAFQIKMIAFGLMLLEHTSRFVIPEAIWPIAVGRLSFPLFAWLAGQGYAHTSNLSRYLLRLLALGALSQPAYVWVYHLLGYEPVQLNMVFTLGLGVALLALVDRADNLLYKAGLMLSGLGVAELLRFEGGMYAIAAIFILYWFRDDLALMWLAWLCLHVVDALIYRGHSVQLFALLTPLIIMQYSQQRGRRARWFYALYPSHLLGLALLDTLLLKGV